MTRPRVVVAALVILAVAAAAAGYVLLLSPHGTQYALPACGQLPSAAHVEDAIHDHDTALNTLRDIDPAIQITSTRPCPDDANQAAILITVPKTNTADQVSEAMKTLPALGVPATIKVQ